VTHKKSIPATMLDKPESYKRELTCHWRATHDHSTKDERVTNDRLAS